MLLFKHSKSQTEENDHQPTASTFWLRRLYLPAILAKDQIWRSCDDNEAQRLVNND